MQLDGDYIAGDAVCWPSAGARTRKQVNKVPFPRPTSDPPWSVRRAADGAAKWVENLMAKRAAEWLELLLPCTRWIKSYRRDEYLQSDIMCGITIGVMLVPQSMSYARLAGLHPIYGLYTGFIPIFIYAIFGSSRQLAVGPVALVSLFTSNELSKIADPSDKLYTELAILLSFMVGVVECLMGLLRFGWIVQFVSHTVISGFTTASAIVIALSQIKYFLGYSIVRSSMIIPLIKSIVAGLKGFSWPPFVMGSTFLAILLVMKHLGKSSKKLRFLKAAGPLTPVVLGTVFVKIFHPSSISVVGEIPQGIPGFAFPRGFQHVKLLVLTAVIMTGVAILESMGIAKALAAKNGYELDPNQELLGLGVSNIFGSFFSAYTATGSFSRSAVSHESGAKTGLSGLVSGVIMGCALLFLTPVFTDIPQCALASIVISAVLGLIDYKEALHLWRVDKTDFVLWTITFIMTLFFGIEIGVLVGVGLSLAMVISVSASPYIAVLGRLPGTTAYWNNLLHSEANEYSGIVAVRVDGPMFFANISYIKERLLNLTESTDKRSDERIQFLILEMSPVTFIDSSAIQAIKELHQQLEEEKIQICIASPSHHVHRALFRSKLVDIIGEPRFFVHIHEAVRACRANMQALPEKHHINAENPTPSTRIKNVYAHITPLKAPLICLHIDPQD